MDPDGPVARAGRTFWTVWCYITEAVNRFLRPEPADADSSDPNSVQDSSANGEPTEDSTGGGGHREEPPPAPACLVRASGVVSWDSRPQSKTQQREDAESKASEEQETRREERFSQTGSDDGGHATAEKGEGEHEKCEMYVPKEAENEEHAKTGSVTNNDTMTEGSRRKDGGEEAHQGTMTPNTGAEKREETVSGLEVNKEDQHDLEEVDGEMDTYKMTDHVEEEENVNKGEAETGAMHGDVENHVSVLEKSPENENKKSDEEDVSTCKQLSDVQGGEDEDEGDEEDVNILQEREQSRQENTTGPAHKQTMDENPEQEDGSQTDTGGRGGKERLTDHAVSLDANAELNTEEEQEDVAERTKANCVNASTTCVFPNDSKGDEDHRSGEEDDDGATVEISRAPTSVTVKPEAETPQETSRELEHRPPSSCEGRAAVSPGLHSTPSEETREGVPEYNNEPGPDENTPQTFLEVGDGKEMQTTQLREEAESPENTAAGDLLGKERGGDEQEEPHIDTGLLRDGVKPLVEQVLQKSRVLFEQEEGDVSVDSMKTGIERSEKEFEPETVSADDTTPELHNKTEELLAECGAGGRLGDAGGDGSDSAGPVAAGGLFGFAGETSEPAGAEPWKIMNPGVFQESSGVFASDENCNVISGLLEDNKSGLLTEPDEEGPKTHGDCPEGTEYEPEEAAAEDEAQNKIHVGFLDVRLVEDTVQSIKETDKHQDEAFEISNEQILKDTEATDELIIAELQSKGLTVTSEEETEAEGRYVEGTGCRHEGVIDEEILDLWIQAVSSEDTDQIKQEAAEQQADAEIQQEPPEPSSEVEDEQLTESNAGESRLVSDAEASSFTAESGFLEQPLELSGTESFQDYDMLASMSEAADADQSDLNEEESVTEAGFITDSGVAHQEQYKSQEGSDGEHTELLENDTESQREDAEKTDQSHKTDWRDTGVDLQTNEKNAEETEVEVFRNELKHCECEHPKSGSDVSLEDEIKSRASSSQVDTWAQPETFFELPSLENAWPECHELHVAEVFEHPVSTFEDMIEVDASLLDFTAQRSRIALKNPRVRPPKDPRSLLHLPSLEPTPTSHLQVKVPAGGPLGGLGVGIKLPGLGAGFPVLKKTRVVTDENSPDTSTEPETKTDDKSDLPKHDEVPQRPKWMPPKHPGFGNPLMSELKTKLKKTTKE